MKKRRLAILAEILFNERDFQRFGLNILSKYFDIYLIDFSSRVLENNLTFSKAIKKEKIKYDVISIKDYEDFHTFLNNNPLNYYIDLMNSSFLSFRIRSLLKKKNTLSIKLNLGLLPWAPDKINLITKVTNFKKRGKFLTIFTKSVLSKIYTKLEPRVDIFLNSGSISKSKQPYKGLEIWTHSFNYQSYLETENDYEFNDLGSYALFIDQYAPSHPDYKIHNNKPPVTEENYYNSMNSFFDFFTKKTGLKIVIAGHPRRNLDTNKDWNGRMQIFGKTSLLIRQASIVLSHYSTALSYAVIFRKPILLITTDEYWNSYRKHQFLAFSEALKIDIINVDKFDEHEITKDIYFINEAILKDYEEKFIRSKYSSSNDIWHHFSEKLLEVQLQE